MKNDRDPERIGTIARRAAGAALREAGLACVLLIAGCIHAPRQATAPPASSSAPAPPPASKDPIPTVSVDLTRAVGENTTFHATATERQKFQVHLDFGKVFEAQGDLDRALQEYQDALKVAEHRARGELTTADEALAHRRIASALDRLGQFSQSEPHYQKAGKLAPKDAKVWNDVGYSYYLQGRWADSERSLRTALKLAPDDAKARTNLGMALAAAGKTAEALPLLSGNQGDAIGHANLGYLLASTGEYGRARQEYQAALSMRPDLLLARRALAQLDRQERGIAPGPAVSVAQNSAKGVASRSVDPQVTRTSAATADEVLLPPLPQLPATQLSNGARR
jgi:tetratricopeptide (TPR) repeat protein